jgi:hypothetical protein
MGHFSLTLASITLFLSVYGINGSDQDEIKDQRFLHIFE